MTIARLTRLVPSLGVLLFTYLNLSSVQGSTAVPNDSLPTPAASSVIVLLDDRNLSAWQQRGSGEPAKWKVAGGAVEVLPGAGDILTKREFGDCQLHMEFNVPLMPEAHGQARGNSGVYLQGLYEVQVLDSYGRTPRPDDCGAIYGQAAPLVNACRKPGEWQTYDILFHAPRFDAAGAMVEKPRISVLQNGIWIQDNVSINGPTTA